MENENKVKLIIAGEKLKLQEISKLIEFESDMSWEAGDEIKYGNEIDKKRTIKRFYKDNGCIFNSGLTPSASVEEHVENLMEKIKPFAEEIKKVSKDNCVELACTIYDYSGHCNPGFHFKPKIIETLTSLGASLDIDLYMLGKELREEEGWITEEGNEL